MILCDWGPDDLIYVAAGEFRAHSDPGAFPRQVMAINIQCTDVEEVVIQVNTAESARALGREILAIADEVWGSES